eukprot:8567189-Ditylum_brightwellii.AAC.1
MSMKMLKQKPRAKSTAHQNVHTRFTGFDLSTQMYGALPLHGTLASYTEAFPQHLGINLWMVFLTATNAFHTFHILFAALSAVKQS